MRPDHHDPAARFGTVDEVADLMEALIRIEVRLYRRRKPDDGIERATPQVMGNA